MSSKDVADSIRRIVAVRDGQTVTAGYEQSGMSYQNPQDAPWGARPNVDGKRGIGLASATGAGGGIASPLVETDIRKRTYYDEGFVSSSHSLFVVRVHPIKSMEMVDANGLSVVLQFAEPPRTTQGEWDIV
ncbi:MAG: hypothetical protein JXR43_07855 [Burkholderiaceae bacterium]|nr:hypothetical protein [Burkholderiaceae bacterium]